MYYYPERSETKKEKEWRLKVPLTGALLGISSIKCPHCGRTYGDVGSRKGHSKKQYMRCLYTADYDLANASVEIDKLKKELNKTETPDG